MEQKKRTLGWISLFAIASGTMISSGIFILPGLAYEQTGSWVPLVYLLAGLVAFSSSLALIELATAMPRAGGDYFYITRSMGPGVGTILGLLSWLALMLKTSFAVFGLAELVYILTGFPLRPAALIIVGLFLLINLAGTSEAVSLEIVLVFFLLLIMGAFSLFGLGFLGSSYLGVGLPAGAAGAADGLRRITAGAAFVFVSFGGLLNVSTLAEEVKDPGRNIPRAIILSILVITILYVLMVLITTAILPPDIFSGSLTPIADAARSMVGQWGAVLIFIASALAFATTGNAGMMSASRYPLAMARDGLLPPGLSREGRKGVPVPALLLTGLFIALAVLMPLDVLVKVASTVVLISYMAINAAVIILRESGMRNYRPLYRLPGYPFVPVLSLIAMGYYLVELGISSLEILLLFAGGGLLLYLLYGRRQSSYEFAALHLIRKAVDRRLQEAGLEQELREILRNRDELSQDLVDRLLAGASLLDIDHPETVRGAFQLAGSLLAGKTGLTGEELGKKLEEREKQFSTALTPFVSIPHMFIPGQDKIQLCLLRCRAGIEFDEAHPDVKAMMILVGSPDRREDHLKVLAGLAHIIQHENFESLWLEAENLEGLRDDLILLDRKRLQ